MKHKHYDLIVAWANGAKIQRVRDKQWVDDDYPEWFPHVKYRINPREFEEGRFYPVIDKTNVHYVAKFLSGEFFIQGLRPGFTGDGWVIGQALDIEWAEGE